MNKEVSALVFVFGLVTAIKMFMNSGIKNEKQKKYLVTGILILTISLMQLVEMFLWMNQRNVISNIFWSKMIVFVLFLQLVSYFSANIALKLLDEDSSTYKTIVVFFSLFLMATLATVVTVDWGDSISLKNNSSCRLNWGPFSNKYAFMMGLFYIITTVLLSYENYDKKGLILFGTSICSALIYSMWHKSMEFGSLWCFLVVLLSITGGIFNYLP